MKRILLIEDDKIMRENTSEILELAGFNVETADNGKIGCTKVREMLPDLIVCDIMMPELDGYGVLHILAKDPKTAQIPFIFLTAKTEKIDMRKGMEMGADDYLTKPFEEMDLLNAIESRLKKSEMIQREIGNNNDGLNDFFGRAKLITKLEDLPESYRPTSFKKKQIIYNSGDDPHYIYFLNSGRVKVYKTHDDGKEFVLEMVSAGQFFGVAPLFENMKYSDSAIVLESSEITKIPKNDFVTLVSKNRDVAVKFIKMLSNNIEERERQLLSMAYDTVRKRTAESLIQLKKQCSDDDPSPKIRITRDDLAAMAGTATETVIRCLSEFKEDGLIEIHGREIIIIDPKGLAGLQY